MSSADELLSEVVRAFGVPDDVVAVGRVSRAWSNRVWSVRTTVEHYAVKELLNPWDDPLWREWLDEAITFECKAIEAGVRAPAVVLAPDGSALVTVGDRYFRAHEWIDGAQPCPDGPVSEDVAGAVAEDLATMHRLRLAPSRDDVFPMPTTATCDGWPDLVERLQHVDSSYAAAAESLSSDIVRIRDWFMDRPSVDDHRVMSHGDVDQKNLLLARGTTWLVDWDVAAPWMPAEEVVRTAMSLANWSRPAVARAFLAAYSSASGIVIEPDCTLLAHDLRISLDWIDRCLRIASGLLPATPQRRAESREQVARELTKLPSRVEIAADLPGWLSSGSPSDV